jgi:hypothetical protein
MSSAVLMNRASRTPRVLSGVTGGLAIVCAVLCTAALASPSVIVVNSGTLLIGFLHYCGNDEIDNGKSMNTVYLN